MGKVLCDVAPIEKSTDIAYFSFLFGIFKE